MTAPNMRRVASRAASSRMRPWAAEERRAVSKDQRQGEEEEEEGEEAAVADGSFPTSTAVPVAAEEGEINEAGRVDGGNAKRAGKAAGFASLVDTKMEAKEDKICVTPSPPFNALEITCPPFVHPSPSTPTGAPPVGGETKTRLSKEGTTAWKTSA